MHVSVNGKPHNLPTDSSVAQLLTLLKVGTGRIAMEVNGDIVPRSEFETHQLADDDRVEIVQAIGGG